MVNKLKTKEFDYPGSDFTENEIKENGYIQLTGKELFSRISNRTIFGDYPMGYKFVTNIYENGTAKGVNNVGTFDNGTWSIDFKKIYFN